MKKHSPIEDTDLISARKAALGWKEDADLYKEVWKIKMRELKQARSMFPIFLVTGIMIGCLGTLIAAGIITNIINYLTASVL